MSHFRGCLVIAPNLGLMTTLAFGQPVSTEAAAKARAHEFLSILGQTQGASSSWQVRRIDGVDDRGQPVLQHWSIATASALLYIRADGRLRTFSLNGLSAGSGSEIPLTSLWQMGETINRNLIGSLPSGWKREGHRELGKALDSSHLPEVRNLVELTWRDGREEPTTARIVMRLRRDSGQLVLWRAFVPARYGPDSASITVQDARARLREYASEVASRYPELRNDVLRAAEWCAQNAPKLCWTSGGGDYHLLEGKKYWTRDELRLTYEWMGTGMARVDANTGELFALQYLGPPRSVQVGAKPGDRSKLVDKPLEDSPKLQEPRDRALDRPDGGEPAQGSWTYLPVGGVSLLGLAWFWVRSRPGPKT